MTSIALAEAQGGEWTLGVKIGLPFACVAALILLIIAALTIWYWLAEQGPWSLILTVPGALVVLGLFTGAMLWAYWPLKAEYHQYRPVSGTVATIANRLVSAGDQGGSNQKFVVVLTSGSQQYGVEDTRAALLHPGDHVSLQCIRVYEYGSTNAGYDCKWGQS